MATTPPPSPVTSVVSNSSPSKPPQTLSLSLLLKSQLSHSRIQHHQILRRECLKGVGIIPLLAVALQLKEPPHSIAKEVVVGSYLPTSSSDPSFVLFKASPKDTPALRAGTLFLSFFLSSLFVLHFGFVKELFIYNDHALLRCRFYIAHVHRLVAESIVLSH